MKKIILLLIASFALTAAAQPKREFRSTWFATVANIDWPLTKGTGTTVINKQKQELTDYLDKFEKLGLNGICFHVRSMADACYKSSYEPWSSVLTGTRGKDPGWDPLEYAIEECHKRGMECYAWVNPYRWTSSGANHSTAFDNDWKNRGLLLTYGTYTVFNPGLPEAREHILKVCREIITNYAIDGMLFDDYFYPNNIPETTAADDYQLYKSSGTTLSIGDWRRANVNLLVKGFKDMIDELRPDVRFGISPAGVGYLGGSKYGISKPAVTTSDWQYATIYSDPVAWLAEGTIDFISPQIYWFTNHATAPYEPLCKWWTDVATRFGRHFYSSQSVSVLANENTSANWAEIATQVQLNRRYATETSTCGSIYFSSKYFDGPKASGLGNYLKNNVYQRKALVPKVTWKNHTAWPAPAGLSYSDGKLAWTATDAGNAIMRYSVYAVPTSVSLEDATTADGIDGQYLVNVTYSPAYDVSANENCWYAVCAYDGYGYESEPAVVNYPTFEPGTPAALISPADGADCGDEITFSWSNVGMDSYRLEISNSASFATIKHSVTTSGTATTVAGSRLGKGTWYWRVISSASNLTPATSDVRSFTITSLTVGSNETGYQVKYDPATYQITEGTVVENLWMRTAATPHQNISFESNGMLQRDIAAIGNDVYLSRRAQNTSDAAIYLDKYDGLTGEKMSTLQLSENGSVPFYPLNSLSVDDKGTLCISNLTINALTTPLVIHTVNLDNGQLTEIASIKVSGVSAARIDHAVVTGDAKGGNFEVWAALSSNKYIMHAVYANGVQTSLKLTAVSEFYPAGQTSFGIAARVLPVGSDRVLVNGGHTQMAEYSITDGTLERSFDGYNDLDLGGNNNNGMARFSLSSGVYTVYPSDDEHSSTGHRFRLVRSDDNTFGGMRHVAHIPAGGMGSVASSTSSSPIAVAIDNEHSARIYTYAVGNGLSAYRVSNSEYGGVSNVNTEGDIIITGGFGFAGANAPYSVYNLSGALIAESNGGLTPLRPGLYLIRTAARTAKVTVR